MLLLLGKHHFFSHLYSNQTHPPTAPPSLLPITTGVSDGRNQVMREVGAETWTLPVVEECPREKERVGEKGRGHLNGGRSRKE